MLLAISDVTTGAQRRKAEGDAVSSALRKEFILLREKAILLQEVQHRVANSLQIIASVLMVSARKVQSEETRGHLHDAHHRVMSIAAVQQQRSFRRQAPTVSACGSYFTQLCHSLV